MNSIFFTHSEINCQWIVISSHIEVVGKYFYINYANANYANYLSSCGRDL